MRCDGSGAVSGVDIVCVSKMEKRRGVGIKF